LGNAAATTYRRKRKKEKINLLQRKNRKASWKKGDEEGIVQRRYRKRHPPHPSTHTHINTHTHTHVHPCLSDAFAEDDSHQQKPP
jgi:hypothetical protein